MDYMMIHRYSKIMHIASRVESDIRPDCDALDAVEAILPAGTLSGAPKIRACEIMRSWRAPRAASTAAPWGISTLQVIWTPASPSAWR